MQLAKDAFEENAYEIVVVAVVQDASEIGNDVVEVDDDVVGVVVGVDDVRRSKESRHKGV